MGNRGASGVELASKIQRLRKEAGKSTLWLAEKVGISYSTFRRRLEVAPENLTFRQLHLIASALDVSIEDLILISEGDESAVAS